MAQSPPATGTAGGSGSRRLLRQLRGIMAGEGDAEARLGRIVGLIAAEIVAEVCSIYVMRAGEVLELFATEGLNREAIHKTRLRVGEGLIGDIAAHARPLAESDAWAHPGFAYRPETGEELFRSLMGVPILRSGRVIGVLAVQNRAQRHYAEEEVETLETVAMVVAELVTAGEFVNAAEAAASDSTAIVPRRLEGSRLVPGLAIGQAVLHKPSIVIRQMVAEDPAVELDRLRDAVSGMHSALDDMMAKLDSVVSGELRDVMESYRMFAEDRGWLSRIREAIRGGLTADAAVQKVQNDMRARMREVSDPYLRERLLDLEDLTSRLLLHLAGGAVVRPALPDDAIVLARNMGPTELLDYDRHRLRALVLEEGSPTSHVAIVARALDIPVVGRVKEVLARVQAGDVLVVDGDNAQVFLRPGQDVLDSVRESVAARHQQRVVYAALKTLPTCTQDGQTIKLLLNTGLLIDMPNLDETGADGIGLYRTEIPFMVRSSFPDLRAQTDLYGRVLDLAGDRPVTFRTLDIGGDKTLPYFHFAEDENPAMGWRAIRIGLDRPSILQVQLRALLRAASSRGLSVMFPMVAEVAEFRRARALLHRELNRMPADGIAPPAEVRVGVMVEVPSLLWQLPALLQEVDFLSVGSNDLMQFLFASDRGSAEMADRFDTLSPGALRMLRDLVAAADQAGVPITLCGEMAGRPLEAMVLIGLGFRRISMAAASIGPVKQMLRSLTVAPLSAYLDQLIETQHHSLRQRLRDFARDHGVKL